MARYANPNILQLLKMSQSVKIVQLYKARFDPFIPLKLENNFYINKIVFFLIQKRQIIYFF